MTVDLTTTKMAMAKIQTCMVVLTATTAMPTHSLIHTILTMTTMGLEMQTHQQRQDVLSQQGMPTMPVIVTIPTLPSIHLPLKFGTTG